ncbi:hypothetical protein OTB17_13220 [Massilia sp. H27-R4]|nr:hypothetical protein [Massilia sp. H27-R4]
MFIIEGRIQALRIANGTLNLVKDIQKGVWFTGLAAGLAGQARMLANAASLALYEGEDVEHIALLINDELAVGTFEWLEDVRIDDEVKLVVSKIDNGPLFIHAILRKNDQLLWMPYSIARTRFSWIMHGVKLYGIIVLGSLLTFGTFFIFDGAFPAQRDLISVTASIVLITAFVVFMSTRGMMSLGMQAEDIYSALEVPEFEKFKLNPFSLMRMPPEDKSNLLKKRYIFKFDEALKRHKKKYKLL